MFITKHGTYIDGFSGRQTTKSDDAWTARAVLESEPRWLKHFHLFELDEDKILDLNSLAQAHSNRDVNVVQGDSNSTLPEHLPQGSIPEREATFCLLDQRTFECEWQLVKHVSRLRPGVTKVEQFYFLANSWMDRSLAATTTVEGERRIQNWLGSEDWSHFAQLDSHGRRDYFVRKFKEELGYRSAKPWPIYSREGGKGHIMYYMIHATDHEEAPKLMWRAYVKAVDPPEEMDQLQLDLDGFDFR